MAHNFKVELIPMLEQLINHIQQYTPLPKEDVQLLHEAITAVHFKKKDFLLREGQTCDTNYFIVKGCTRSFLIGKNGHEKIIHFGIENWWTTDYDSFFNQHPSVLNIQAVEDLQLLKLKKVTFDRLMDASPNMERYFRIIFQKIFIASQRRIEYMFNLSGEELYYFFCEQNPDFLQRVPQYMLASYLGFTPEFLSKIRGKKK